MSKYEDQVAAILKKNKIDFVQEKTFHDLKKGILRYDFFIPNYKGNHILLECDGPQHFSQVKHFQPKRKDFLHTQENDRKKNAYCLAHNIPLYRIPFWDFSIIQNVEDLFQEKFRVTTKWWNDLLRMPT